MSFLSRLHAQHPDLAQVTYTDLEAYLGDNAANWKPSTMNAAISSIRVFYKWAHRFGHVTENPAAWLDYVRLPRTRPAVADDAAILRAVPTCTVIEAAIILLGRVGGLRRTEIATLRTADRRGEWLYVTGKGGNTRVIHLAPDLLAALVRLERTGSPYYFPGRFGGHKSPESVYQITRRLVGINPHALRHRAASAVYTGTGGDLAATQEFLGHASVATTMLYIHLDADSKLRTSAAASLDLTPTLHLVA
jgi:integrase